MFQMQKKCFRCKKSVSDDFFASETLFLHLKHTFNVLKLAFEVLKLAFKVLSGKKSGSEEVVSELVDGISVQLVAYIHKVSSYCVAEYIRR